MLVEGERNKTGIIGRPRNMDERLILAAQCATEYKFTIPMVIDGMGGAVNGDYDAAPVRTTITDIDGKVVYYAGRGPFDFRLSKIEKILGKLSSNNGRFPAGPAVSWGEPVNGLRLGLSVDPPHPAPGDEVSILLRFENVSKETMSFYYGTADPLRGFAVKNGKGRTLTFEPSGSDPLALPGSRRRGAGMFRIFPQQIAAGDRFQADIEARLPASTELDCIDGNPYRATFFVEVTEQMTSQMRRYRDWDYWQGTVTSGAFEISVTAPDIETCMSCHGVEDYHHAAELECVNCHTGEEGTENFKVNKAACTTCHPREGIQGRRLIRSSTETSPPYTVHVAGRADDDTCLTCHDNEQHRKGEVLLIEPRTLFSVTWAESQARFCLGCHGGEPPAGMSFPATRGSGFDKSAFLQSRIFTEGMTCSDCHAIHGSPLPDLLKEKDLVSPH